MGSVLFSQTDYGLDSQGIRSGYAIANAADSAHLLHYTIRPEYNRSDGEDLIISVVARIGMS